MEPRGNNQLPPDKRREDAAKFIQEHTGLPARSIGSQIAEIPPVPQPSSPLASLGKPPTEDQEIAFPAAEAVTQVDVIAGLDAETRYMMPDNYADGLESPQFVSGTFDAPQDKLEMNDELPREEIEAPQLIADEPPEPEPAPEELPEPAPPESPPESPPEPEQPASPPAEQPQEPPTELPAEPTDTTPAEDVPETPAVPDEPDTQQDMTWELPPMPDQLAPAPDRAESDSEPVEIPSWAKYTGPVDQEVVDAGGNPMMAKRTDLSHEDKMRIATEGGGDSPYQQSLHEHRQANQERTATESSGQTDTAPPPTATVASPQTDASEAAPQSLPRANPDDFNGETLTSANVELDTQSPGFGTDTIPVAPQTTEQAPRPPMRDRPQMGDANQAINNPSMGYNAPSDFLGNDQPMGGMFAGASSVKSDTVGSDGISFTSQANSALDAYDQTIQMIIAALSRLAVMSIDHQSRLSTILDRLDSEATTNEFGEGESMWLG